MADDVQDYEDDSGDSGDLVSREHIKQLEEQARKAKGLEAELETVRRESAFAKALGSSAEHPGAKWFIKAFDGPLDTESIRAAATEAGFLGQQQNQQQPPGHYSPDSMERIFAASAGGQAPAPQDWNGALAEADRIADPQAREDAILSVVERYGGVTSRTAQ